MSAQHIPRKRFGQNFLHDEMVISRIIASIRPLNNEHLVEIGPGKGAITLPLLQEVGALDVIELDRDLVPMLERNCAGKGDLTVYNVDALKFDFTELVKDDRPLRVVGNLPYNISTPLIFHLLAYHKCIRDMHFMLQREVVERMAAPPGSKAYGRLSVMVQYRCHVESLFIVRPESFTPVPKVQSAIVRLMPYDKPPVEVLDEKHFEGLVRQAFSYRRKTLRNSLKQMLSIEEIESQGISPTERAENLPIKDFANLSNLLVSKERESGADSA